MDAVVKVYLSSHYRKWKQTQKKISLRTYATQELEIYMDKQSQKNVKILKYTKHICIPFHKWIVLHICNTKNFNKLIDESWFCALDCLPRIIKVMLSRFYAPYLHIEIEVSVLQ